MMDPQASEEVRRIAEQTWASSPAIRHEFCDNKESFLAYRVAVAQGRVKTFGAPADGRTAAPGKAPTR